MRRLSVLFLAVVVIGVSLFAPPQSKAEKISKAKLKPAIDKSLKLLQFSSVEYTKHRKCFSCHNQAHPAIVVDAAQKRGYPVDEEKFGQLLKFTKESLQRGKKRYHKGLGQGGGATTAGYALLTLELGKHPPDELTEAVTEYLLKRNKDLDHYRPSANRPPSEASRFASTYVALRALKKFGSKKQQKQIAERIKKVQPWVIKTKPKDTEDRAFHLWTLDLLKSDAKLIRGAAGELRKQQRKDGGWAQTAKLKSDPYATGLTLVALHETNQLKSKDPAFSRGVQFLLDAQKMDGSWHVKSRSRPFQLYFETGFPHKKDQFISVSASSWATAALLQAYAPALAPERKSKD